MIQFIWSSLALYCIALQPFRSENFLHSGFYQNFSFIHCHNRVTHFKKFEKFLNFRNRQWWNLMQNHLRLKRFEINEAGKEVSQLTINIIPTTCFNLTLSGCVFRFYDEVSPAQGFEKLETCNQQFGLFKRGVWIF